MKKILYSACVLSLLYLTDANAQITPKEKGLNAITSDAIRAQMGFLDSDWTEGREAGQQRLVGQFFMLCFNTLLRENI